MNGFWVTAKREISRIKSSKFMLVMIFVLPIFFSFVIWWTFSAGTVKDLPIAVLDLDNSDVSRGITRAINSTPSTNVKYKVESYNQGYNLIKSGQAYALIVFPQHFKKDLNRFNRPKIVFYYNNQTILIGGILSKDIQSAVITSMKAVDAQIRMKKGLFKCNFITHNFQRNWTKGLKLFFFFTFIKIFYKSCVKLTAFEYFIFN